MILRYLTYVFALLSSAIISVAIGAYMTVASGMENSLPIISLFLTLLIFGIFSWLHFFYSRAGLAGLILLECAMLSAWPGWLWENDQEVWLILFIPGLITIFLAVFSWKKPMVKGKYLWVFSVPPFLIGSYYLHELLGNMF